MLLIYEITSIQDLNPIFSWPAASRYPTPLTPQPDHSLAPLSLLYYCICVGYTVQSDHLFFIGSQHVSNFGRTQTDILFSGIIKNDRCSASKSLFIVTHTLGNRPPCYSLLYHQ